MEDIQILAFLITVASIVIAITTHYMRFLKIYIIQVLLILVAFYLLHVGNFRHDIILVISFCLAIAVRLVLIPTLIYRSLNRIGGNFVERKFHVPTFYSLMIQAILMVGVFFLTQKLGVTNPIFMAWLFVLFSGLYNFLNHRKLVGDILSFLLIENGVFLISLLVLEHLPLYIEVGIIIDILMSVSIMLISTSHIKEIVWNTELQELSYIKD